MTPCERAGLYLWESLLYTILGCTMIFLKFDKKLLFFWWLKVPGDENMSSAYFDPDAVVFDGFDYAFGIKRTLVCKRSCRNGFYEILMEFILLIF